MKVIGTALVHVLLGALVMLVATAVHRTTLGLLLGIATSLAVLVATRPGARTRIAYGAGWLLAAAVLMRERPEGDAWFAGDLRSYALLGTALVVVAVGLATLPPRRHLSSGE